MVKRLTSCCLSGGIWLQHAGFSRRPLPPMAFLRRLSLTKSGANLAGLQAVNTILKFTGKGNKIEIRQIKYLNNILEQDHGFIKRITKPMMGFKAFHSASATIEGIEVAHMIRKNQFANDNRSPFQVFATQSSDLIQN